MKENTRNSQIGLGNKDLLEERPLQLHTQFLCIYFLYTCTINRYKCFFLPHLSQWHRCHFQDLDDQSNQGHHSWGHCCHQIRQIN